MEFDQTKKPKYIFKYPFRFVKPYKHVYETYAKKRWLGKNILSTLSKQFLAYSEDYFRQAIKAGKITINGKNVTTDYIIRNSDLLQHQTIRQQPPILDLPIEIIHEDEEFLVINKPPSMVVHTGGGYHYNSLLAILYYEMGYKNLYILHRLDRLTSGVVILAKQKEKVTKFHEQSMEEVMKKCYFARVSGDVNFDEKVVDAPMVCLSHKEGVWGVYDPVTMEDLLKNQQVKESSTKFVKIWYDQKSDSSLLECFPITGRTHQIRVHLKHIGHPILNDVVYDGKFVGNCVIDKIQKIKQQVQNEKQIIDKVEKKVKNDQKQQDKNQSKVQEKEEQAYEDKEWYQKWDYKTKPLQIMLHSYRYKFEGNQYKSRKPYWTQIDAVKSVIINQEPIQIKKQNQCKEQKRRSTYETAFLKQRQQKAKQKVQEVEEKQNNEKEGKLG